MKRDAHSKSTGREGRLLQEHPCLDMASFGYTNSLVTRTYSVTLSQTREVRHKSITGPSPRTGKTVFRRRNCRFWHHCGQNRGDSER